MSSRTWVCRRAFVAPTGVVIVDFPRACLNSSPKPLSATSNVTGPEPPLKFRAQRAVRATVEPFRMPCDAIGSWEMSRPSVVNSRNLVGATYVP